MYFLLIWNVLCIRTKKLEKDQKAWDQLQMLLPLIFQSTVHYSILTFEWSTASSVFITLVF